jgi:hypothetical protein
MCSYVPYVVIKILCVLIPLMWLQKSYVFNFTLKQYQHCQLVLNEERHHNQVIPLFQIITISPQNFFERFLSWI